MFLSSTPSVTSISQTKKEKAKAKVSPEVLTARQNLGLLSLKCMAELLSRNYNFNLRSNIVNTLIPYGASKAMGGKLADVVTATIVEVKTTIISFKVDADVLVVLECQILISSI